MTADLVLLAVLMGAVTYPSRAIPFLAPGMERLPGPVLAYLRLVGPAVLAALAAANVLVTPDAGGHPQLHVGIETVAVVVAVAVVAWRRNLLLGVAIAVGLVMVVRALGAV